MANEYQAELNRINQNIADAYSVLQDAGAATPAAATSDNLAATASNISAVLYNKAQILSETQKTQARNNIGALAESELDAAITDALDQAKESGEFDGTSVAVASISESTEDGGTNVVTFSDGKKLNVKNGSKGGDGAPGATGPAGRGVKKMEYNEAANNWTVTYTDNTTETVAGPSIPQGFSGSWNDLTDKPSTFAPSAHTQAASTILAGTFAGQVVANGSGQTPGTYLLRNSKISASEENPTVNGQICWVRG